MDRTEYVNWLLASNPGDRWTYWEGNLAMNPPTGLLARDEHNLLTEVRYGLEMGLITSVQRRIRPADNDGYGAEYEYIAIRQKGAAKQRPRRAEPSSASQAEKTHHRAKFSMLGAH